MTQQQHQQYQTGQQYRQQYVPEPYDPAQYYAGSQAQHAQQQLAANGGGHQVAQKGAYAEAGYLPQVSWLVLDACSLA